MNDREENRPVAEADARTSDGALITEEERHRLHEKWQAIQTSFIDEPRQSVEEADHLVEEQIERLGELFRQAREELETTWSRGEDVSTEALRLALQRYRAFFERLLSV
jgi:hypothetical protein